DALGSVKLSDFGTSRFLHLAQSASVSGTVPFMAPEVFTPGHCTMGSDIWALACSVIEMATGLTPWSSDKPMGPDTLDALPWDIVTGRPPPFPPNLSVELHQIVERCFASCPTDRPTALQLLALPYFNLAETSSESRRGSSGFRHATRSA